MQDHFSTSPIEPTDASRIQEQANAQGRKQVTEQVASQNAMTSFAEEAAFDPIMMQRDYKTLEERLKRKVVEKEKTEQAEEVLAVEELKSTSEEYEEKNPELLAKDLQELHLAMQSAKDKEEVLRTVLKRYSDHSLADEALEFLEKSSSKEVATKVREAKEELNANFGREVKAGRNITADALAFSKEGLDSSTGLRDLYRDITGNPREATDLFVELTGKFSFGKMEKMIEFILSALGSDLKAKGPSIPTGELHKLMGDARNLLAVLWVYRFFQSRMDSVNSAYQRAGAFLPKRITFELLAQLFVGFLRERYPSIEKLLQLAMKLGISGDLMAQVILFTQMRDAVRGVAPRLYRSPQHRHDVLMAFLEALEEIEEGIEKQEEEQEKKEKDSEEEEA